MIDQGRAEVRSWVDRTYHAVISRGRFDELLQAYVAHASEVSALPDDGTLAMMRKALVASTLHLALLPPDQHCSWTLNLASPQRNLFVAGDNEGYRLTGRAFSEDVKAEATSRLFYETQRPRHEPARSVVDFDGLDVFAAYRALYRRGLQMRARLFDLGGSRYALVQGLPMVDRPWLEGLEADGLEARLSGDAEPIETRVYRLACGCALPNILVALRSIFAASSDELFGGEPEIEVQCPRCGRGYVVERRAFDEQTS